MLFGAEEKGWNRRSGFEVSQDELYDCIIVGGGPGGLTAGMYAMRAALKTVLIEKGVPGGQVAITKGARKRWRLHLCGVFPK